MLDVHVLLTAYISQQNFCENFYSLEVVHTMKTIRRSKLKVSLFEQTPDKYINDTDVVIHCVISRVSRMVMVCGVHLIYCP